MFYTNFKIDRLKFAEKLFIFYLFCLFFSLIPAVKAKSLKDEIIKIINFPNYENNNGTMEFSCPSAEYTEEVVYTAFSSPIGAFIPIIGLLFTVAVYGTKSAFGYITTCHLDDIVIFTSSLAPIFAWYTVVKLLLLIFLYLSYMSPDSSSNNKDIIKMYKNLAGILVGLLVFVVIVLAIIKICFHKRRMKCFFHWLKTFIIWIYFFNSLEIILYSVSEQILFFPYIVRESIDKKNLVLNMTDLVFLNYLMNLLYFLSSFSLVLSYHFPNLLKYLFSSKQKRHQTKRPYQGFIRKKIFFFTISLSIAQLFFEYYFICTPPFVSTVFNTVLTTVLTRSIASFFSDGGVVKYIHKHKKQPNENDVDEERIFAKISPKDIGKVKNIYIERDEKLEKYRVDSVKGYFYVYKKGKKGDPKPKECFYVMIDKYNDSVYFLRLNELNPREEDVNVPWHKKIINKLRCKKDEWEEKFLKDIEKKSINYDCNMGNECETFQERQDIFIKQYYNKTMKWNENIKESIIKRYYKYKTIEDSKWNENIIESIEFKHNCHRDIFFKRYDKYYTIEDSKWNINVGIEKNNVIANDSNDVKAETNEKIKSTTIIIDDEEKDEGEANDKSDKIIEIKGFVLVNIIETGLLNYIIYSHRRSEERR